jgi:ketosteroid isomerase-like protein
MRLVSRIRRRWSDLTTLRRVVFALVLGSGNVFVTGCEFQRHETRDGSGVGNPAQDPAGVIREMLQASAVSWNVGDLDGFMDDYWQSEDLTFSGANGVTRGWENVKTRYLQSYWAPGAVRDSLRFEEIEVFSLGNDQAIALGRYVLFRPEEETGHTSSGFFTLVLRMMDGGWKIVHDHTSATPEQDGLEGDGA